MSEFSLKYLAKFSIEKRINLLAINGGFMQLNTIKLNDIALLNLSNQGLYSDDFFILCQFLKENHSITHINLSQNFIGYKQMDQREFMMLQQQNPGKQVRYDSLGIEHFAIALSETDRILELDISLNDIGAKNFSLLQKIFKCNIYMELLNLAECNINGEEAKNLFENLGENHSIKYLYLRNNYLGEIGAESISKLILQNNSMIELDLFNCHISQIGGNQIAEALRNNFCVEKFSIGQNKINDPDIETIQMSVVFNTNYNQMKMKNHKYQGFAHNLISEGLKKWASGNQFVAEKLKQRLKAPVDQLDQEIAKVIIDCNGHVDLKPVPQHHEYVSGDGDIRFPKKKF